MRQIQSDIGRNAEMTSITIVWDGLHTSNSEVGGRITPVFIESSIMANNIPYTSSSTGEGVLRFIPDMF